MPQYKCERKCNTAATPTLIPIPMPMPMPIPMPIEQESCSKAALLCSRTATTPATTSVTLLHFRPSDLCFGFGFWKYIFAMSIFYRAVLPCMQPTMQPGTTCRRRKSCCTSSRMKSCTWDWMANPSRLRVSTNMVLTLCYSSHQISKCQCSGPPHCENETKPDAAPSLALALANPNPNPHDE